MRNCPYCHFPQTMSREVGGFKTQPVPGDLNVCRHCFEVSILDRNNQLCKLTPEEIEEINDSHLGEQLKRVIAHLKTTEPPALN